MGFKEELELVKPQLLEILSKEDIERYSDLDKYYGDDDIAKDTLRNKYLAPWEKCPLDLWTRIAWAASSAEKSEDRMKWAKAFLGILQDFNFIPGGRINYGLGRDDIKVSFSNCYVVPIKEDSLEAIYDCLKEQALTYKTGGGCGTDISILRPKDEIIKGTGGKSCGSVGFMNLYSISTNTVAQHERRGAEMISLLVSHPDIESFITIKNDIEKVIESLEKLSKKYPADSTEFGFIKDEIEKRRNVQYANISVKLTDDFLSAVEDDKNFDLVWGGKVYKTIKARELWNKIIYNAHKCGEPGLIFWDRMKETNNLEYINPLLTTNPCAEIGLGAYGNCLLGHVNLSKLVSNKKFELERYKQIIKTATRFLDNIITLSDGKHPLKEQNEVCRNERRMGLGITGLGDMLVLMGMKYGADNSLEFVDTIMSALRDIAYYTSCELAKEKGAFPWFDTDGFFKSKFAQRLPEHIKDKIRNTGIRNGMINTAAPVGTGSIISCVSSGIEPIFHSSYTRRVKQADGNEFKEYKVFHPLLKKLFGEGEENFPDYVVDSSQVTPKDRVKMQATIQKYIDNSISSTINLPSTATKDDVAEIYMQAWKLGCKGITVYVAGSRDGILKADKQEVIGVVEEKRYAPKRPTKLEGETYKLKVDITGQQPINSYITVNFEPGTRTPCELLVTEMNSNKEFKDIAALEVTSRLVSLCLRHHVPIKFISSQLNKVRCTYVYSLPVSIANILENYIDTDDKSNEEELDNVEEIVIGNVVPAGFVKCPSCGGNAKKEGICLTCSDCGFSKCS